MALMAGARQLCRVIRSAPARSRSVATSAVAYQAEQPPAVYSSRIYPKMNVYKLKAAMAAGYIPPTWSQGPRGGFYVERDGVMLFEFAHVNENVGRGVGERTYNWEKKVNFALSALECSTLLGEVPGEKGIQLLHDTGKGKQNAGGSGVMKTLQITRLGETDYMFRINVKGDKADSIGVSVTEAEMRLLRSIISFLMPRMLGFDRADASAGAEDDASAA